MMKENKPYIPEALEGPLLFCLNRTKSLWKDDNLFIASVGSNRGKKLSPIHLEMDSHMYKTIL